MAVMGTSIRYICALPCVAGEPTPHIIQRFCDHASYVWLVVHKFLHLRSPVHRTPDQGARDIRSRRLKVPGWFIVTWSLISIHMFFYKYRLFDKLCFFQKVIFTLCFSEHTFSLFNIKTFLIILV